MKQKLVLYQNLAHIGKIFYALCFPLVVLASCNYVGNFFYATFFFLKIFVLLCSFFTLLLYYPDYITSLESGYDAYQAFLTPLIRPTAYIGIALCVLSFLCLRLDRDRKTGARTFFLLILLVLFLLDAFA